VSVMAADSIESRSFMPVSKFKLFIKFVI